MRYIFDHDYHIHSQLSLCSGDPEQTGQRILQYALENDLKRICLTDHFWDINVPGASDWYQKQDLAHISRARPLPRADGVEFLFGCETDMDKFLTVGVAPQIYGEFDFMIIPTTHMHMRGFTISDEDAATHEGRAKAWISRLEALLDMPLPFRKIGIAHLACPLIDNRSRADYLRVMELIDEEALHALFTKAATLGVGIELNSGDMRFSDEETDVVLRPFRIAKQRGCKFYCGSDAHHPSVMTGVKAVFNRAIDLLGLTEDDKFHIEGV